jgi:pre-mRNA-splicing helicase BRR2
VMPTSEQTKQKLPIAGEIVPLSDLPLWAREAFIVTLNHILGKLYPVVFSGNEHIFLCAPTEVGKVCNLIKQIIN